MLLPPCCAAAETVRSVGDLMRCLSAREEPRSRINADTVVEDLVVNVISHAGVVTTTVKTAVSGNSLALGNRRRDCDTVGVTVEDHYVMTCSENYRVKFSNKIKIIHFRDLESLTLTLTFAP